MKVLIVDDEVDFASALAERLELRGYLPGTVNCGKDALAVIEAKSFPDVILLDLKMLDMSGFEVLVKVKEKDPSIEVIMLTGHGSASSGSDSIEKGAFDFIMKPVDLAELEEKIKQAYQKRVLALK
nr:response regulator [Desulfobulbaceae bacterium]